MASLAEEMQIRIDLYGGREKVIRDIEAEWYVSKPYLRKSYKVWTRAEIKILKERGHLTLSNIAHILHRSIDSVKHKNPNIKKPAN